MYYDPSPYIGGEDELLLEVEDIIRLNKRALLKQSSRGLKPMIALEFRIPIAKPQQELKVTFSVDLLKKVKINLIESIRNNILRKGHFNYTDYHHNPGGSFPNIPPPHHIHFPTKLYPDLNSKKKYAYPVSCSPSYEVILKKYCDHCNILTDGMPISLLRSWGRQRYARTKD